MKAIIWTKYGPADVLQLKEVEKPAPRDNEVLIKIHATTVTAGDCEVRNLKIPIWIRLLMRLYVGFVRPKRITILGQELSGEVESVGKDVKHFKKGDPIFAASGFHFGGYAEYVCLPSTSVMAIKPVNMTYEEAAAVPVAGLEALHFLRQVNIERGQKILINGAGGSIGTFAVQLAKYFGAEVIAVDRAEKLDMLRSIGADRVIDYALEDFTQNSEAYDVIFDVPGKSSFLRSVKSLKSNGRYAFVNAGIFQMIAGKWVSLTTNKQIILGSAIQKAEDLIFLKKLIEAGKLKTIIDRRYPLEKIVEAHRYAETGSKIGNVVITVAYIDQT